MHRLNVSHILTFWKGSHLCPVLSFYITQSIKCSQIHSADYNLFFVRSVACYRKGLMNEWERGRGRKKKVAQGEIDAQCVSHIVCPGRPFSSSHHREPISGSRQSHFRNSAACGRKGNGQTSLQIQRKTCWYNISFFFKKFCSELIHTELNSCRHHRFN